MQHVRLLSFGLTIVDCFCPEHFELSLDIWVKVFDKVEMIGQFLPLDEIFNSVLVPDIAFPSYVRDGLCVCMNGG